MRIHEVTFPPIGKRVKANFYDIYEFVKLKGATKLSMKKRKDLPSDISNMSGLYAWHHPDFGYFYFGITHSDGFMKRWKAHVHKLLDRCAPRGKNKGIQQMNNWREFNKAFVGAGYGLEDFKDITLHYYPVASVKDYPGNEKEFQKYLTDIETRIVNWLNPACNGVFNPDKPSSTRQPEPRPKINSYTGKPVEVDPVEEPEQ